ncbi:mCG1047867 [Mus musculus]|nr:mCG1047867 [Mus musculus]
MQKMLSTWIGSPPKGRICPCLSYQAQSSMDSRHNVSSRSL